MKNTKLIFTGLLIVLIAAASTLFKGTFYLNMTRSEPVGLYKLVKGSTAKRGDLVFIKLPAEFEKYVYGRGWLPQGWPLLKKVGGIEGDLYCYSGSEFTINQNPVGTIFKSDSQGLPLPVKAGCFTVKKNNFLPVATGLISSFDSRYFGEISTSNIIGVASPILTF